MGFRRGSCAAVAAVWSAVAGCGDARVVAKPAPVPVASTAPPASASAAPDYVYPDDGPIPSLRTGAVTPIDFPDPISSHVAARYVGDMELLLVEVPLTDEQTGSLERDYDKLIVVQIARANASTEQPYSFAIRGADHDPPNATALYVWVRRPTSAAGTPLRGDVYTPLRKNVYSPTSGARTFQAGMHLRFAVDDTRAPASDPKVTAEYGAAFARHLDDPEWGGWHRGPWNAFAASRLRSLAPKKPTATAAAPSASSGPTMYAPYSPPSHQNAGDLAELMATTTGVTAIQEALQHDRALILANARAKRTASVATVKGPALSPHPWKAMLARLKSQAPAEPLATATPAEFYFARANDFAALLRVTDHVQTWGTPLANVLGSTSEDRGVLARYEVELGIKRGPLTERLGPTAITDMAIVGSDPYLVEGSDVTLVFRPRPSVGRDLLNAALAGALATHEKDHGAITHEKRTHEGVDIAIARSADGAVRQQRATVADFEIVSNSATAIDRVIATAQGKRPRLSDELDFQYMLARDASIRADVLAFFSDRFVSEVIGPKQKILEARRQIALAELATPGFAALLYGRMYGKSPAAVGDLTRTKLLDGAELTHGSGGAITWKPGTAARSAWGTVASLTPLIDLPTVDKITDNEKASYLRFAGTYQSAWKHYVDPVAVRIASDPTRLTVDVRELPLIDNSDYKEIAGFVGDTRIDPGKPESGMRAVFAIGQDSPLRQELDQDTRSFFRKRDLSFDWIADWAAVGVLDRATLATATITMIDDELPQLPKKEATGGRRRDEMFGLSKMPVYVAVGVRNPVAAAIAITAVRAFAEETLPGMIEWSEAGKHRGVGIARIGFNQKEDSFFGSTFEGIELFYSIAGGALVVSPSELVVRKIIDQRLDGKGVKGLGENPSGSQLTFDVGGDAGGAMWTTMTWLLEMATLDDGTHGGRATAEALMRGAPDRAADAAAMRALAIAYFGAVPVSPDGGAYAMTTDGLRDPMRGTLHAPVWPKLPVDDSPVARIVRSIKQVRTELGFDEEPGSTQTNQLRSMHAKAVFELR